MVVRCHEHEQGCGWTGDLRELDNHSDLCSFKPSQQEDDDVVLTSSVAAQLTSRLKQCEDALRTKDKEISVLQHKVERLEQRHQKEINDLKEVNKGQQSMIVRLTAKVETLQGGTASCQGEVQNTSRNPLVSSRILPASSHLVKQQPGVVEKQNIVFEHHNGDKTQVTISH